MITRFITFTPEMAKEWLSKGSLKGPPDWETAARYAKLLDTVGWIYNNTIPIMRCEDGRLINCGGRLAAITMAKKAVRLLVLDQIPLEVAEKAIATAQGGVVLHR